MPDTMTIKQFIKWMAVDGQASLNRYTQHAAIEMADEAVELARSKLGAYQPAIGIWPEWPPLAPSTGHDMPLFVTGELHDSIQRSPVQAKGQSNYYITIFSDAEYAAYQEFGTADGHVPARPFLAPAVWETIMRSREQYGMNLAYSITPGQTYNIKALKKK